MRQNLFKGAAAEYRAAAYYIDRGEIVYWPAVPLETDFIIERTDGRLEKIQVKYTSWNKETRRPCEKLSCKTSGGSGGKYDLLFVISEDGRFWEIPASVLPVSALKLDTRGVKYRHKGANSARWDEYLVSPANNEKEHQ